MEKPIDNLFWGLVVEQGKQYKQNPQFNFHVSMAVLDLKTADNEAVSVYVQVESGEFILCNLTKAQPQVHLDLIFSEGEKMKFYTAGGKGSVHMTGYVMPEDDFGDMDDEFSDEEVSIDSDLAEATNANVKRKITETLKLTGKDAKKLKTGDNKVVEKQQIVDVDPKQLLNKKTQDKQETKKAQQPANQQQKAKPQQIAKMATKDLEVDSEDDDLSEDDESVDLNNLNKLMEDEDSDLDDLNDEDLESDDDDLDLDDEDDIKMSGIKNKANKSKQQQAKQQVAGGQKKPFEKPHQGKPNQQGKPFQKQQNGQHFNKFQNKSPQQHQNKSNSNTPHNKGQFQKHQQTPFNKGQQNNSNKKPGTPPNKFGKKSFGSQNKQGKKVFS